MPTKTTEQDRARYDMVDLLRAMAIIMMIVFHGAFDLTLFGFVNIDFRSDLFWWTFPRVIVFFFLFPMGQAMEVVHGNKIKWSGIKKRMIKITVCAAIISAGTYVAFPTRWIYFGTLHCIATCTLLILPFLGRPLLSFLFSLALLIPMLFGFRWPWWQMQHASMDYIPALPWIAVVMLGASSVKLNLHKLSVPDFVGKKFLLSLSKNSLVIYLVHQPILFSLVWIIRKISNVF